MPPLFGTSTLPRSTARAASPAGARPDGGWGRWSGRRALHWLEAWISHAPHTLRAMVRADEIWLVVLASVVGVGAGLAVVAMSWTAQLMHTVLFRLNSGEQLSASVGLNSPLVAIVPAAGGIAVGLSAWAIARWIPRRVVDPIEANALYGGVLSLRDSIVVVGQTVLSNGVGASVGLEAGYSQIGSAMASRVGRSFRVRRNDLRLLVGCGTAGAIAAAFNAPLTGAFYGFELVIGTYSIANLAPVSAAAICAITVMRVLTGGGESFDIRAPSLIETVDYVPILALGMVCALAGIALMRGVTLVERLFRESHVPAWLRPAVGGLVIGAMALLSPAVLSSGHSALQVTLDAPYSVSWLTLLLLMKATASAVSIGSGFRGGLFFASLFLGALVGKIFAALLAYVTTAAALPAIVCAVVGMTSLAVAVVGGPLTMSFLALETTGSLPLTVAVLAAAVVSAITVRRTFGYSFATWRFHLRGEAIRGAVDIGWMRNLTVGRMMRREFRQVRPDLPLASFRREFALGSIARVVAVDERGQYAGLANTSEAHAADAEKKTLGAVLHHPKTVLLPQMTIKEAVQMFETSESDALAVVDGAETMKVIGVLTEQYALRRYSEELDRRRRELSGER